MSKTKQSLVHGIDMAKCEIIQTRTPIELCTKLKI